MIARLAAAGLLLLSASAATAAVKNPDTFTHLSTSDIDSLDPAWAYDTSSQDIIVNVYEFLLAYQGAALELAPKLATKVPSFQNGLISKDGRSYTFPIRKGVRFQDGQPLTPEDVKYSLLRFMLLDRVGGPSSVLLQPILGLTSTRDAQGALLPGIFKEADEAVRIKGDNVVIRLKTPYAPFLSILAGFGAIVSKPWCLAQGDWDGTEATLPSHNNFTKDQSPLNERMNGTGPFRLERWDKKLKQVILVRNDSYWRPPAKLERIVIKAIEEFATRKLMLEAGDADSIVSQLMTLPQVKNLPGVQVIERLEELESPMLLAFTFSLNPAGNPNVGSGRLDGDGIPPDFFKDRDVREAFAYAIDYEAEIRDLLHGQGGPASGVIPKGLVGYWPRKPIYRFDLDRSREHWKKAWGGKVWEKGFRFTLPSNEGQPGVLAFMNMIRANIESLNPKFEINVRPIQWSTFLEQSEQRKIPLALVDWAADYPDAHDFVFPYLDSSGYYPTKQGYSNPKIDRLIQEAVTTLNVKRREALYREIQTLADQDLSLVPISTGYRYRTQRSWVKGWIFNPIWPPDTPYGSDYYLLRKEEP